MERFRRVYLTLIDQRAAVYLGLVVLSVGLLPPSWTMPAIYFWMMVGMSFFLFMIAEVTYVQRRYPGKLHAISRRPGPLDSMFDELEKVGVTPKDIKKITFESADINGSMMFYYNGKKRLLENPDIEIVVYGKCKSTSVPKPGLTNMQVIPITKKLTRHVNLIETHDGKSFVWLEPFHDVIGEQNYFTTGAYLIEIDQDEVPKVREEYARLPLAA